MPKPGVMLYFDLRPCLKRLTQEQKGQLFEAILEYGEFGAVPNFDDDIGLAVAWDLIRPMIDRDNERYEQAIIQRKHAAYSRECKRNGETPLGLEEWKKIQGYGEKSCDGKHQPITGDNDRHRPMTDDNGSYPTTTTTPSPSTSTTATPSTTTATTTTATTTPPLSHAPKNPASQMDFEKMRRQKINMLAQRHFEEE